MDSLPVILVGIIGLVSVVWQFKLFEEDGHGDFPVRLTSGLVISAIILIGGNRSHPLNNLRHSVKFYVIICVT